MTFTNPAGWWLLALAVPLVVLALHLRKRSPLEVPSLRVWRDLAGTGVGRRRMRRVRDALALAATLLAVVAAAAALSDPRSGSPAAPPARLVIVLDASVTMNAVDGEASRFDAARDAARAAIDRLGVRDDVTIWLAAKDPYVLAGPTAAHDAVRRALRSARPTLHAPTLLSTVSLARVAIRARGGDAPLLVITDAPGAASLGGAEHVTVAAVGSPNAHNDAITAVERVPGGIRVHVRRYEGDERARQLVISAGGDASTSLPVDFANGATATFDTRLVDESALRVDVRLTPPDDFPEDDSAALILDATPPLRVVVLAPNASPSPFLVEALAALDPLVDRDASLVAAPGSAFAAESADVVVLDGVDVADAPRSVPTVAFIDGTTAASRVWLRGDGGHPVADGIDPAGLRLDRVRVLEPSVGESVLADGPAGPVLTAGAEGGVRRVRIGFRPGAGTLPLDPAFPVLLRNALVWARGETRLPGALRHGGVVPLAPLFDAADEARLVVDWQGGSRDVDAAAGDPDVPIPSPESERVLVVRTPGGRELGRSIVAWQMPDGVRVGVDAATPLTSPETALAALPPAVVGVDTRKRHAGPFAACAALLLLLAGMLVGKRAAQPAAAAPPPPVSASPAV